MTWLSSFFFGGSGGTGTTTTVYVPIGSLESVLVADAVESIDTAEELSIEYLSGGAQAIDQTAEAISQGPVEAISDG
jgi:isochorismate hydrolase